MIITSTEWKDAPWTPRYWQVQALEAALRSIRVGQRGLISAIMGAGKSVLLAELIASCRLEPGEVLVVTCPTQALVKQLSKTLAQRVSMRDVGLFYADFKHLRPILVTCNDSMGRLAKALTFQGLRVPLWIADEAHKTETPQVKAACELLKLDEVPAIGLTATPFRSNPGERLSLWESLIYRYAAADAVRDGVIVPWRVKSWTGAPDAELDHVCAEMISAHRALGPGVANARSIADADAFAELLRGRGIRATTIHSGVKKPEGARRLDALRRGEVDVVVYVSMLAEGVDMPWLRWMCLRRRVAADVRFAQEAGRIIRADEGKTHGLVLDPINLFSTMDFAARESIGVLEAEVEPEPEPEPPPEPEPEPPPTPKRKVKKHAPVALSEIEAYLKQVAIALVARGARRRNTSRSWRSGAPSPAQRVEVRTLAHGRGVKGAVKQMPERDQHALRLAFKKQDTLTRGGMDDLALIFGYLNEARHWDDKIETAQVDVTASVEEATRELSSRSTQGIPSRFREALRSITGDDDAKVAAQQQRERLAKRPIHLHFQDIIGGEKD